MASCKAVVKPDSSDHRTTREKLLDVARDPGASEGERNNARTLLARLTAKRANPETPRPITREAVFAQPDDSVRRGRGVRVKFWNGVWVHMDEADVDWRMVDTNRLYYRFDGENETRRGGWHGRRQCAHCKEWFAASEIFGHIWSVHTDPLA